MTALWWNLQASPGSSIEDVCAEMVKCANSLNMDVWVDFNSVMVLARPGDDVEAIVEAFRHELRSDKTIHIAVAQR